MNNKDFDNIEIINNIESDYTITTYFRDDVIKELNLNEKESELLKSMIVNLEKYMKECFVNNKIVAIPTIGKMRKSPVQTKLIEKRELLKLARHTKSKEEYKIFVKDIAYEEAKKDKSDRIYARLINKIKRSKNNKYEHLVLNRGLAYANVYILSILLLDSVDFDQEVEDAFNQIK